MGLEVEFSRQCFRELLIKLLIVESLNFSTCSRREGVTLPVLWYLSSLNISCFSQRSIDITPPRWNPPCRGEGAYH